jgi:hypothetical protein
MAGAPNSSNFQKSSNCQNCFENRSIVCVEDQYEIKDPFGVFRWIRRRTMIEDRPIQQKQSWMSWVLLKTSIALIVKILWTKATTLW